MRIRSLLPLALSLASATGTTSAAPPVPDTMAQRLLACTGCHGSQGRASPQGYVPRLAGKPAQYLLNQLHHFREGRRANAAMTPLLDTLSPAYLREMAQHFAGLDLPYPAPPAGSVAMPEMARGLQLAQHGDPTAQLPACVACHGPALTGRMPATPGLLGLPRDYMIGQLGAWQTGLRRAASPDCMATIARRLTAADVSAVARWLAAQPVPPAAHPQATSASPAPLACGSVPP
jgi:cytochrome c553